MTPRTPHLLPYEQPCSEVSELETQGVLCQSPIPDVETQNMENPNAPSSTDYSW